MIYPALHKFLERTQRARGIKSAEFRITVEEAQTIALELAKILLEKAVHYKEPEPVSQVDGGKFVPD